MIDRKQPYFIALYNLHLTAKEISLPEEKEKLVDTVYRYFDSLPWNKIIPQETSKITGEKSYKPLFEDGSSIEITPTDWIYHNSNGTDWWTEGYKSFLEEYVNLRSLMNGYVKGIINFFYLCWLNERLKNVNFRLFMYPSENNGATPFPIELLEEYRDEEGLIFLKHFGEHYVKFGLSDDRKCWNYVGKFDEEPESYNQSMVVKPELWVIKPEQFIYLQHQWNPVTILFFPAYMELIDLFKKEQAIHKCQLDKCNNIFLKSGRHEYCSDKCSHEAKLEGDRKKESAKRETERNHQTLCDLIELWLKLSGNGEWLKEIHEHTCVPVQELKENLKVKEKEKGIPARKLKKELEYLLDLILEMPVERLKKYLADHERNYAKKNGIYKHAGEIPFLGDNVSASSLGQLLKEVEGKLKKEKRINMTSDKLTKSGKKKKRATYQFMIER